MEQNTVSLYTDDLLLYVRNPSSSIPRILSILDSFCTFSGYKLNVQNSECLPVNQPALDIPAPSIPFQFSSSGFKYLGVVITRSIRSLREQNVAALTSKVKLDLQRWSHLPLSLAGRVQIVKMNVLPRYLYLFQCLPIFLPRSFFKGALPLVFHYFCGNI